MSTKPRSQSRPQSTTTPTPTTTRTRTARRPRADSVTTASPQRYITLGEGSRFEFALGAVAMAAMWVAFIVAILAL